jgi:hypothetical protein
MLRRVGTMAVAGALLGAFALVAWAANGASTASALTNCDTTEAGITPAEQQMLTLINQARASVGLNSLVLSPTLDRAAAWKSADPSATGSGGVPFSHTDSTGRDPFMRMTDCGYRAGRGGGENIAFGSSNPATIFAMWMESPGHRGAINGTALDGSIDPSYMQYSRGFVAIGIGEHFGAWTTDFGYVDDSGAPPPASTTTTAPPATSTPTSTPSPTATPTKTPSPTPTPPPAPINVVGVTLPLSAGMNLVTYAGPNQPVANALGSLRASLSNVYEWDAASGHWLKYAAGLPAYVDSFTAMEPGRVYYIELRAPEIWTY